MRKRLQNHERLNQGASYGLVKEKIRKQKIRMTRIIVLTTYGRFDTMVSYGEDNKRPPLGTFVLNSILIARNSTLHTKKRLAITHIDNKDKSE